MADIRLSFAPRRVLQALLCAAWLAAGPFAQAGEAAPAVENPVLEAQMLDITAELRCLVCQNQTIADSHADLAVDLRQQVREQLQQGRTREQILQYMTDRYGDFVLYRPPFKATTALLWGGPALLLIGGLATFWTVLRRRNRLSPDQFEPDDLADDDAADPSDASVPKNPSR